MFDTNAITELAQDKALRATGKRITGIDEVTRAGVRDRIREAIDQGMSPREAGQYVAQWSGWDEYRAERIARTETMFAYNSAAITTYGTVGVTHVVADDGDKDAECAARHGGTFTLGEAAEIFDHPNGTLDWLPVAPGIDPDQVRRELSSVREVSMERLTVDPPASDWKAPLSLEDWRAHPEYRAQLDMFQTLFQQANEGPAATIGLQFENSATAVNRYYRSGGKMPGKWTQAKLDELDALTKSQVVQQETYVYRGVQGSRGLPRVGETFGEPGLTSVDVQYRGAARYADRGGQGRAVTEGGEGFVYRIRLDPGQAYGGRLHPVLPRNTQFRVVRVRPKTADRPAVVDLEVIP